MERDEEAGWRKRGCGRFFFFLSLSPLSCRLLIFSRNWVPSLPHFSIVRILGLMFLFPDVFFCLSPTFSLSCFHFFFPTTLLIYKTVCVRACVSQKCRKHVSKKQLKICTHSLPPRVSGCVRAQSREGLTSTQFQAEVRECGVK